ncbi:MAG TPA: hypothetical protein VH599_03020 [Ktedonobacterales bacterium]
MRLRQRQFERAVPHEVLPKSGATCSAAVPAAGAAGRCTCSAAVPAASVGLLAPWPGGRTLALAQRPAAETAALPVAAPDNWWNLHTMTC